MKIKCVLIGLTLCVAGCGGGGGSGAAGGISVQTPAPIAFSSGTTVLSEDKMHVSVGNEGLRTLAAPDWQNNLAQHTGSDHAYIARRDQNYVAIPGQFDDTPFVEVLGNFDPIGRQTVLRYDEKLDIRGDDFNGSLDIGLQVNLGSIEPRLTTYTETLKIDVSASINSDGSFSNGLVTFLGDQAELTGGFFITDSAKQNETLAGAFAAETFYGTLLGQVAE